MQLGTFTQAHCQIQIPAQRFQHMLPRTGCPGLRRRACSPWDRPLRNPGQFGLLPNHLHQSHYRPDQFQFGCFPLLEKRNIRSDDQFSCTLGSTVRIGATQTIRLLIPPNPFDIVVALVTSDQYCNTWLLDLSKRLQQMQCPHHVGGVGFYWIRMGIAEPVVELNGTQTLVDEWELPLSKPFGLVCQSVNLEYPHRAEQQESEKGLSEDPVWPRNLSSQLLQPSCSRSLEPSMASDQYISAMENFLKRHEKSEFCRGDLVVQQQTISFVYEKATWSGKSWFSDLSCAIALS